MRLLLFDVVIGVLLLAAIAAAAYERPRVESGALRTYGWLLVAVPLPAAVAAHLTLHLSTTVDQTLFVAGAAAFALGAALLLRRDDEGWREEPDDDAPPWWPAFERELRDYERASTRRPKALQP
jgi:hypothetical protein